ncbi:MAG: prepilin-type N-terminal cleavage/methylation domain-containing protein [Patescibacteria group bacterium]
MHDQRGQTLVEVIVAIGVVVLLVTGLIVSTSVSLKASQYGKMRSLGTQYANEAIEVTRNLRDSGWSTFAVYGGVTPISWCLDKAGVWTQMAGTCSPNIDNFYTRMVTFTWDDPRMKVDVAVTWVDGAKTYSSLNSTFFTQWK